MQWTRYVGNGLRLFPVGHGMFCWTIGRDVSLILSSFANDRGVAECFNVTRLMMALCSVSGSRSREKQSTQWTLIIANALKHCRVGRGMHFFRNNGTRASPV